MSLSQKQIVQIRQAQILAFPTDTVAGLFAPIANTEAIKRLFLIKNRPEQKTMMLLLPDQNSITTFFSPNKWQWEIILANSPGQTSFLLPLREGVILSSQLYSVDDESFIIGFRIPSLLIAQSILQITGPLAQTSLNISGEPPIINSKNIPFRNGIDFIYEFQNQEQIPSTIIRLYHDHLKIVRQGKSKLVIPTVQL